MNKIELCFYGVRGSSPIPHKDYLEYGGNTASLTLRTPENNLIFIDAGTGIKFAQQQLDTKANNVWLVISHTHADHIMGLGMSHLPWLETLDLYKGKKVNLIGPKGVLIGLNRLYDGTRIWPVSLKTNDGTKPAMMSIDTKNVVEYQLNQKIKIDNSCSISTMKGNHPVVGGVILYRFDFTTENGHKSIVYATDNEFQYKNMKKPNTQVKQFKKKYLKFIQGADILIADAQYSTEDYTIHKGFGHSYPEEIVDLGSEAKVSEIIITHHHDYPDSVQDERQLKSQNYAGTKEPTVKIVFAKEGMKRVL